MFEHREPFSSLCGAPKAMGILYQNRLRTILSPAVCRAHKALLLFVKAPSDFCLRPFLKKISSFDPVYVATLSTPLSLPYQSLYLNNRR